MIEVDHATYVETGIDSQRHEVGTVTVDFAISCGDLRTHRLVAWEEVDANDFRHWQEGDWNDWDVPWDMAVRGNFWAVWAQLERQVQLAQEHLEAGLWGFYEVASADDLAAQAGGQVTGSRSPGFESVENDDVSRDDGEDDLS
jgi:hypothetical protein